MEIMVASKGVSRSAPTEGEDDTQRQLGIIAALAAGGPPSEFQVFPFGLVELVDEEPFVVDDAAMNEVIARFEARGIDMVIDYEHQTEGGEYASPDGTAPAAGWVKRLVNKGELGLWAEVEWTERAAEMLRNREYRYYSPVFFISKQDRRLTRLFSLALTNLPRLNWIKPIVAKDKSKGASRSAPTREDQGMEFLILCAKLLGCPDGATQDQVVAALKALQAKAEQSAKSSQGGIIAKDVLSALELPETAGQSEVVASIHALRQKPDLTKEVASLKQKLAERDRDDLVASAIKAGKITTAQREWAEDYALRDPAGFKLFVAKAPQVVPLDQTKIADNPSAGAQLSETALKIAKIFGNTEEDIRKYAAR